MRLAALVLPLVVAGAAAQEPSVSLQGPDPAVVKLGDQAEATLTVSGSHDAEIVGIPRVADLVIRSDGPSQSSYSVFDGRRLQQTLSLTWRIRLRPERTGTFEIPPIEVRVGRSTLSTKTMRLEVVVDLTGKEHAFLSITTPKTTYFVHEPIRVSIRYGIDQRIVANLLQLATMAVQVPVQIRANWLDDLAGAVPYGRDPDLTGERFKVFVNESGVEEALLVGTAERDGRSFHVFELAKDYLPVHIGELELSKPTLFFRHGTRFQNSAFGERRAVAAENAFVYGEPTKLVIKAIPEAGRPADYTGGVGRFRISAEARPKDLKVGESLKLTLTIEGEGNLEFLEPPNLDRLAGFHMFGKVEEKTRTRRTITYDLTPLSDSVKQVPPITFSYFDTSEPPRFDRASTEAIPLVVRPLPEGARLVPLTGTSERRVVPGVDDILDMKPVAGTPAARARRPDPGQALLLMVAPWLAAGASWVVIRRRERALSDPAGVRARAAATTFRNAVTAGVDPADAFTRYLADRLCCPPAAVIANDLGPRLAARGVPAELAARAAAALDAQIEARYAGATGPGPADEFAGLVEELEAALRRER